MYWQFWSSCSAYHALFIPVFKLWLKRTKYPPFFEVTWLILNSALDWLCQKSLLYLEYIVWITCFTIGYFFSDYTCHFSITCCKNIHSQSGHWNEKRQLPIVRKEYVTSSWCKNNLPNVLEERHELWGHFISWVKGLNQLLQFPRSSWDNSVWGHCVNLFFLCAYPFVSL